MTVFNQIRSAISGPHESIEKTAFSIAMINGRIGITDYVFSLTQLYAIHEELEAIALHSTYGDFFDPEMIRTAAIKRDIAFWGARLQDVEVMPEAVTTVRWMRETAEIHPVSLLGFIYVMEGSRMGSLVIVKPLASGFQVAPHDGQGLDYHTEGARKTPGRLAAWKLRVEQSALSDQEQAVVKDAAVGLMQSLNSLYERLPASEVAPIVHIQSDVA
jgi:heme oxygenase